MNNKIFSLSVIVSIAIVIVGLKFTSIGSGPGGLVQNDGYSVTGGFLTLIGGFLLGLLYANKPKK